MHEAQFFGLQRSQFLIRRFVLAELKLEKLDLPNHAATQLPLGLSLCDEFFCDSHGRVAQFLVILEFSGKPFDVNAGVRVEGVEQRSAQETYRQLVGAPGCKTAHLRTFELRSALSVAGAVALASFL